MTPFDPLVALSAVAAVVAVGAPIGIVAARRSDDLLVLCCIAGPLHGRMLAWARTLRIGRSSECDLRLDDAEVSRQHAIIEREGRRVRVRDVGSCTGVWSDGRRLFDAELSVGDQFQIGNNVFMLLTKSDAQVGMWPAARVHRKTSRPDADYESIEPDGLIHTGAHYTVMRARRSDGGFCIVKYLHDRRESVRSRFDAYLAAAMTRTTKYPTLVRVRGGSASAPQPYVVEDFVDGASLRIRMAEGMSQVDARSVMSQLLTTFENLHATGIGHGALDSGDVLFARDGSLRLLGVGNAHVFDGVQNCLEDDVAALAGIGEALFGSAPRYARARFVGDLRRRWGIDRQLVAPAQVNDEFLPLRLRVRGIDTVTAVTSNPFVLGRALNPADRSLSRRHAELVYEDNRWMLRLRPGSRVLRNGIVLAADAFVAIGDELRLGETVLVVAE